MPGAGFTGTDTFTYRANDGTVDSNLATVTIRVETVANTEGKVTGGGYVDHGVRRFELDVKSQARRTGGFSLSGNIDYRDTANDIHLESAVIQSFRVNEA